MIFFSWMGYPELCQLILIVWWFCESASILILDESGTAENKVEVLFSHDKLSLTSTLRLLHQVTEEMLVHLGRGASYFSLIFSTMVSICIHLPTPPSLYLHVDLQQHHLGKFLYNILLLTFPQWPDEAASVWRSAKACHVKIILLLCFQQFQTHLICI